MKPINLFYAEPDPDRWFKFDRYPRKLIRRIYRGKQRPGGVMMVALQLMKGLDLLKIPYRFNDHRYANENPEELIGVIGKPHLIFEKRFKNPILFGAGVFSHPVECPEFFEKYPNVKQILVPGPWMQQMCEPYYGTKVKSWPAGIDTKKWIPNSDKKTVDFLIYNKIRWDYSKFENTLIQPIKEQLERLNYSYKVIKYGEYSTEQLNSALARCKSAIFLCEHETQGLAYQQILATDTPILAWDRGGFWQDPYYYPEKVKYQPVSSVPYWDERCGEKFSSMEEFKKMLSEFSLKNERKEFNPRDFILENLTLEKSAMRYVEIYQSLL